MTSGAFQEKAAIDILVCDNNNNNDHLTAFDPGQPG